MRNNFKPAPILASSFAIANPRIQAAMASALSFLNGLPLSSPLLLHLTSCKFVTSWDQVECFLTLSYGDSIDDACHSQWTAAASSLSSLASLTAVTARFKKQKLVVGRADVVNDAIVIDDVTITYEKPEDAFQHPNATTMHKALSWILDEFRTVFATDPSKKLNLLEMYCGCGAHTMALGKVLTSSLWNRIVAVELDERLVDSCAKNIELNGLADFVTVTKGDAGSVSKRIMRSKQRREKGEPATSTSPLTDTEFDILLVDPPRQGLDEHVIKLAVTSGIDRLIYVSCGRHALQRDLALLDAHFSVVGMLLTDLFPRTDSVETLVHLKRK
jgi:tRNA/tmRNA/rRNA uracil-C5-methylase (TrmA/RlmC/RlmD family)